MSRGLVALAAAFVLVCGVSDAIAQPYIQQTASDSVLIEGVLYPRYTFSLWNFGGGAVVVRALRLASTGPDDTCGVIRATGPGNWTATVDHAQGVVMWVTGSSQVPYGYTSGFQVVETPGRPAWYYFDFGGVTMDSFGHEYICFGTHQAVPARGRTWGALKALYR